jgi:hypothetical protein
VRPHLAIARQPGDAAVATFARAPTLLVQRTCTCGGVAGPDGECTQCRDHRLRRTAAGADKQTRATAPPVVQEVLASPGRPLDRATRADMEHRFGHSFSDVRVHADGRAAESARAVHAVAYTFGSDVVFASDRYRPETLAGRHLLAHELSHVLQQRGAPSTSPILVGRQYSALERDAESAARRLSSGSGPLKAPTLEVQRQAAENEHVGEGPEEDEDPAEVRDGDAPVHATPDTSPGAGENAATEPEPGFEIALAEPEEATPMKGEGRGKSEAMAPPKKKQAPPARTITKIDVDQAAQTMTLTWSDGTTEGPRRVSTGKGRPNTKDDPCKTQSETNCTPNGTFKVGRLGNANTKNQHGDAMSWYVGFVDERGIGIHDSQPVPGTPASHGCVRVGNTPADDAFAKKINKNVVPGVTEVVLSGKASTKQWTKPRPKPARKKKK